MELKMRKLFIPLINLIIIFAMSCEGSEFSVKCSDCTTTEPHEATLECRVDLSNIKMIHIWEGKLEDGVLIDSMLKYSTSVFKKNVPLNKHYTITATYIIDNKTYIAVGSALPRVRHTTNKCDQPCYYVYGNEVDLRLKYTR